MTTAKELGTTLPAPHEIVTKMQHYLTQWSGAWTQMVQGVVTAELAQLDAIKALYLKSDGALSMPATAADAQAATAAWFATSKTRLDDALETQRRISDELRTSLFNAAEKLLEAPVPFVVTAETVAAAADAQLAAARRSKAAA
jgi:hypothetical protein